MEKDVLIAKVKKLILERSFVRELTNKYNKLKIKRPISKEQEQEIQNYYQSLCGRKVPLIWHKFLYSRTNVFSKKYIPLSLYRTELIGRMNNYALKDAYADKNIAEMLFPDVKQPRTILKNMNGYFFADGKEISRTEAAELCRNLTDVIIKPSMQTRGKGVKKITVTDGVTNINAMTVENLFDAYRQDYIIQEVVRQHPRMSALNPTSANTIRLLTYRLDGEIVVLYTVIRIGKKDQVIDNESAGGISADILPDGKLARYAYGAPGNDMVEKTDTGVVLDGYEIPSYHEVVETAKRLHLQLPYFTIAAWDFAVGVDGEPIFIEWNAEPDLSQSAHGPAFGDYTERVIRDAYKRNNTRNKYW